MREPRLNFVVRSFIAACLLAVFAHADTSAFAGDAKTREIQRLLWTLDYGAGRLDGNRNAEMQKRITKFLSDRKLEAGVNDDQLLRELNLAFDEKKSESQKSGRAAEFIDRRGLSQAFSDSVRMVVSEEENLVLTGSCPVNRFRLSDSAPLREHKGGCQVGSFVYSKAHSLIAADARWQGDVYGLVLSDSKSGLIVDFIEVPENLFLTKMAIHPNGKDIVILTQNNLWRVDLLSKQVSKFASMPKNVTGGIRFSPDGRLFVASWSNLPKFNKTSSVWDFASGRKVFESPASHVVFSDDGRTVALEMKDSTVEIRDIASAKTLAKRKFESEPDFRYTDESVAFDQSGKKLFYLDSDATALREWDFMAGQDREKQKLHGKADRAVISDKSRKLFTLEGSRVITYDFDSSALPQALNLTPLPLQGGAASPDGKFVIGFSSDEISLVDTSTGRVQSVPVGGLIEIKSVAVTPSSTELLVGTEQGIIRKMALDGSRLRDVARLGSSSVSALIVSRNGTLAAAISDSKLFVIDIESGRIRAQTSCDCWGVTNNSMAFVDSDQRILFTDKFTAIVFDIASGRRVLSQEMKSNVKRQGTRTTWMWASIGFVAQKSPGSDSYWVGGKSAGSNILYEYSSGRLRAVRGSPEGNTSFLAAGATSADTLMDGTIAVVLYRTPKVADLSSDRYASEHLDLREDALLVKSLGDRFVTLDKSGEVRIYRKGQRRPAIRTLLYKDKNWLSRADEGFFDGTRQASENLFLSLGNGDSISLDNMFNALYRPDLVSEAASGDTGGRVKAAAEKLDLEKVVASGPAPIVTVKALQDAAKANTDEALVEAAVSDQGGGIGKIEWRVNGVTLGVETRGLQRLPDNAPNAPLPAQAPINISRVLALEPGENKVEVIAYNRLDLIASDPARLTLKWDGQLSATPPKLHVLTVGVNDYYDSRLKLSYAVPDAKALGDAMKQAGAAVYQSVEVTSVLDDKVTIDNLEKVFAEVSTKVHPRDVFVFFLAGHGKTVDGRYHFLPQNFRYDGEESIVKRGIDQDRFQSWFAKIPARKSILLYDTCESGSLTGDRVAQRGIERVAALEKMTRAMGRTVLSASTDDTPALEGYRGHGVFTYALLDGMAAADTNGNGLIEVTELAAYIDQQVPDLSYQAFKMRQIPQMKIVGSSFPVVGKTAVLKPYLTAGDRPDIAIPTKPTHVVISSAPVDVYQVAAREGAVVQTLTPGTLVTAITTDGGWQLVAKDGQKIGYVDQKMLMRVQ